MDTCYLIKSKDLMLLRSFKSMQESSDIQRRKHLGVYAETVRAYRLSKGFIRRGKEIKMPMSLRFQVRSLSHVRWYSLL